MVAVKGSSPERPADSACAMPYPDCELLLPPAQAVRVATMNNAASGCRREGGRTFKVILERCMQQPITRLQSGIGSGGNYWMKFAFGKRRNETVRSITGNASPIRQWRPCD